MYFCHCEETRLLVSILTYIDAMLLNLDPDIGLSKIELRLPLTVSDLVHKVQTVCFN
jgi:hypothetical protein